MYCHYDCLTKFIDEEDKTKNHAMTMTSSLFSEPTTSNTHDIDDKTPPWRRPRPYHPPLKKAVAEKAKKYISKIEQSGKNKEIFENIQKDLSEHLANRDSDDPFGHTFIEYVLVEEAFMELLREYPHGGLLGLDTLIDNCGLCRIRSECRFRWGATPKYHALLYRDLIHDASVKAGRRGAFIKYIGAKHRRKLDY